jgi:hypothetical protein
MRKLLCLAVALASLSTICSAQTITETFGIGANAFTMDFVTIGNPGNAADTTGSPNPAGSVAYTYNIGKYEVSRDMILKASTDGGLGLTLADMTSYGGNGVNRPATGISWNEAARFVNYLNTSKGYQAAYNFTTSGANANITLWAAGQYSGSNQFRHKNAYYFLPSVDEWYKAAYGSPSGTWYNYTTVSDIAPTAVSGGTTQGTAVYGQSANVGPADIKNAGGLSAYGTMAQGGNVWESTETAYDGINNAAGETSEVRGGGWNSSTGAFSWLALNGRDTNGVTTEGTSFGGSFSLGFRVAMIPEPSSLSLLALGGVAVALGRRRR